MSAVAKSSLAVGFDELKVNDDLTVTIPDRLKDTELTERARENSSTTACRLCK